MIIALFLESAMHMCMIKRSYKKVFCVSVCFDSSGIYKKLDV